MKPETAWFYLSNDSCFPGDQKPQSPIEIALYRCIHWALLEIHSWKTYPKIECQVQIGGYRVDFLIGRGTKCQLVIECDGHDFHERTKEQAASDRSRDRKLTTKGYTVIRFTGSEIYADPFRCAGEALVAWYQGTLDVRFA